MDTWYKRRCDYMGCDNRCARDYRCKKILYLIFLIKTSFDKTGDLFPEIIISKAQSALTSDLLKVAQSNFETIIEKRSLK